MKRYYWTIKEVKILEKNYAEVGTCGCMELLPGRTMSAIYGQAMNLGLRHKSTPAERKRWKSNETIDRLITLTYQNNPKKNAVNDLAVRVKRPRWWVSKRAVTLGLVTPRFKEPVWSEEEKLLLEKHATKNPDHIRKIFAGHGYKRTATAIVLKRKRFKIDMVDINHYSACGLATEFGVDVKVVTGWIKKGWLKAKRRGTNRTPQQGGDMWKISRKSIRSFVVDSVSLVDFRKVDKVWLVDLLANG